MQGGFLFDHYLRDTRPARGIEMEKAAKIRVQAWYLVPENRVKIQPQELLNRCRQ